MGFRRPRASHISRRKTQRAVRSRYPNKGYLSLENVLDPPPDWTHGHTRFRFRAGDISNWPTITNAETVVMSANSTATPDAIRAVSREGPIMFLFCSLQPEPFAPS